MGTKVKMRRSELRAFVIALRSLDGRNEVANDKDGKSLGIVLKPYDLDASAIYAIARTLRFVQPEADDINRTINRRIAETNALPSVNGGLERRKAELEIEFQELLGEEIEVEVHKLKIENLKIGTNKLGPALVSDLLPMLDGEIL